MNSGWPQAVARRIGLGGAIEFTPTRVGQTLHIPCRGRGRHLPHIVDVPIPPGQHSDAIAKKLLHEGWTIGQRLMCPDSQRYKKKEPMMPDPKLTIVPDTPPATPTPAAGRARRLVYMALEEYYDEAKKAYKPPHSDASIAKECGVSEACVRQIREESYGPLAVPLDLTNVQSEIPDEILTLCGRRIQDAMFELHGQGASANELSNWATAMTLCAGSLFGQINAQAGVPEEQDSNIAASLVVNILIGIEVGRAAWSNEGSTH